LIEAGVGRVERLPPDLEGEPGAVGAFSAGVRILVWVAGGVVEVVVVPAAADLLF
jgi:hypothetical protein